MTCGVGLYVRGSAAAAALYEQAFGLTLGYHVRSADGSFFHSELCADGTEVLSVVEAPPEADAPAGNSVQLGMTFADRGALLRAFDLLRAGGRVTMAVCELPWSPCAAEVVDRFGIRWYLTVPQHRPGADAPGAAFDGRGQN
jgi:PhnB protein